MTTLDRSPVDTGQPTHDTRDRVAAAALVVLVVAALATVDHDRVDGYGMWSAVGPLWWLAGLVAVAVGLATLWRSDRGGTWLRRLALGAWFVLLHAVEPITAAHGRFPVSWLHLGFGRELVEGGPSRLLDARFSWPGFLGVLGAVTDRGGAPAADWLVRVWPVAVMAAWAGLVAALGQRAFPDRPVVARLAPWIFLGVSWTGQEYLSPQSMAFASALVVVLVLTAPRGAGWPGWSGAWSLWPRPRRLRWDPDSHPGDLAAFAVIALVAAGVIVSHPLTPFFLAAWMAVLSLAGFRRARGAAVLVLMAYIAWMSFAARPWWAGVLDTLLGGVGNVAGSVDAGTAGRIGDASSARQVVLGSRYAIVVLLAVLSVVAVLSARRRGHRPAIPLAGLAVVLVPAVALQSYGGEMLIRLFLFVSPIAAVLVADLCTSWSPRLSRALSAVALVALMPLMLLGRWGNESYEATWDEDLATMRDVYGRISPSTLVVSPDTFLPWRWEHARLASGRAGHLPVPLDLDPEWTTTVRAYADHIGADDVVVVVTRSSRSYEQEVRGTTPATIDAFVSMVAGTPGARVLARHGDAVAIRLPAGP